MDEATYILFEDYLDGVLPNAEKIDFEKRLQDDPEFASHFDTYQELSDHLSHQFSKERKELKSQLGDIGTTYFDSLDSAERDTSEKKETKVIRFKPWQYGIAASLALLIGFFLFQNTGGIVPEDYLFTEQISLTERNTDAEVLKQAETAFNNGSYTEAIVHFAMALESDSNNSELQFYKALAHDASKQFNEADILYDELMKGTSLYKHKAAFYAAISQWKRGHIEEAKALLKTIPSTVSEYKEAQRILKKL